MGTRVEGNVARRWLIAGVTLGAAALLGCGRNNSQVEAADTAAPSTPDAAVSASATPAAGLPTPKAVWVVLKEQADLSGAYGIKDWAARGQYVYDRLTEVARRTQPALRARHPRMGNRYDSLWIVNAVRVVADTDTLGELAKDELVRRLDPDDISIKLHADAGADGGGQSGPPWGITAIRAPQVWSTFGVRGDGIVVANNDTGVQYDHPALVRQYRGTLPGGGYDHAYSWFDVTGRCPAGQPCDDVKHGTHTMGTMVGDDGDPGTHQIGVAPHAKWIAAKASPQPPTELWPHLVAAQWLLAPTNLAGQNPLPGKRPHVVNNSWGDKSKDGGGRLYFQGVEQAWIAAGIFPVVSAGNDGPGCQTVHSPGDYPESYTVGSSDVNNVIASNSSRGAPEYFPGTIKPDIVAPGVGVFSSVPLAIDSTGYGLDSGTSMAAPHVAGTVALIWSAVPALVGDVAKTRLILDQSTTLVSDLTCGGNSWNGNVWGHGRLDAFKAVDLARRGGTLRGTIATASGAPIKGALLQLNGPDGRAVVVGADGSYQQILFPGTYVATVSSPGFQTLTVANLVITSGATTVRNFTLAATGFPVTGTVRDPAGNPLAGARVTAIGQPPIPIEPVTTDASGNYTFLSLPNLVYDITASQDRCFGSKTTRITVSAAQTLNLVLPPRYDAFGYSCTPEAVSFVDTDTALPFIVGDTHNGLASVTLPFPFPFYGTTRSTVYPYVKGLLLFNGADYLGSRYFPEQPLPGTTNDPRDTIAAFWADLDTTGGFRTKVLGTAPQRRVVIEWTNAVAYTNSASSSLRIQAILHEDGEILLQYAGTGIGNHGTVGIVNVDRTIAFEQAYHEGAPPAGRAVRFRPPAGLYANTVQVAAPNKIAGTGKVLVVRHYVPSASNPSLFVVDPNTNPTTAYGATVNADHTATYTFEGPVDVLRILYGGLHHDGTFDCGSDVRRSLADSYGSIFNGAVSSQNDGNPGQPPALSHLWRPRDLPAAGAPDPTADFIALIGFGGRGIGPATGTSTKTNPFCNAGDANGRDATTGAAVTGQSQINSTVRSNGGRGDFADFDPIRRLALRGPRPDTGVAADLEQVAKNDGTLGLLLPIVLPETDLLQQYPTRSCTPGKFDLVDVGYVPTVSTGTSPCPQGEPSADRCYLPYNLDTSGVKHYSCIARKTDVPSPNAPGVSDNRVFNLAVVDDTNGRILRDAGLRFLTRAAFYRIHTSLSNVLKTPGDPSAGLATARQPTAASQEGALLGAEPRSLAAEAAARGSLGTSDSPL